MRRFSNVCVLLLSAGSRVEGQRKKRTSQGVLWPFVDAQPGQKSLDLRLVSGQGKPKNMGQLLTEPPSDGHRGESDKAPQCDSNTALYVGVGPAKPKHKPPNMTRSQENAITRKQAPNKTAMGIVSDWLLHLLEEAPPSPGSL